MSPDRVFYDGACGLCHRAVVFGLRHDPDGGRFRFAPLQGKTCRRALSDERRAALPDSIVLLTPEGEILVRSEAVLRMLDRIGGGWRVLGGMGRVLPRVLRDAGYDGVARIRGRLFTRPREVCPVVPPEWRRRFDP